MRRSSLHYWSDTQFGTQWSSELDAEWDIFLVKKKLPYPLIIHAKASDKKSGALPIGISEIPLNVTDFVSATRL